MHRKLIGFSPTIVDVVIVVVVAAAAVAVHVVVVIIIVVVVVVVAAAAAIVVVYKKNLLVLFFRSLFGREHVLQLQEPMFFRRRGLRERPWLLGSHGVWQEQLQG